MAGQVFEIGDDLEGELAGGRHDQRPGSTGSVQQMVENGKQERRGLPAPRGRAGQEITPLEGGGNRFGLNGGRAVEAQVLDASDEGRVQLEC